MNLHRIYDHLAPSWATGCDAAIKSAVVLFVGALVAVFFRRVSSARWHLLWTLAIGGTLAIPVLSTLTPSWRIELTARAVEVPTPAPRVLGPTLPLPSLSWLFGTLTANSGRAALAAVSQANPPVGELPPSPWTAQAVRGLLVEIWLVGVIAMLLPTAIGYIGAWRLGRRATRVTDSAWLQLFESAKEQLGMSRSVTLLQSADCSMPMTWGILRAKLLLPCEANGWHLSRRRIVLMHELAHIRRGDCLTQLMAQVARAIYWFNPLSWWAQRQLTVERELACDDVVLGRGTRASDYAEELLAVASKARPAIGFPLAAVAMARTSKLGERLMAILDPARRRDPVTQFQAAGFVAILSLLLVPMSMFKPFSVRAEEPRSALVASNQPIQATAADLPPLASNTRILIRIDASKCSLKMLKQTADTILGVGANPMQSEIDEFARFQDVLIGHGVSVFWIAADFAPERQATTDGVMYLRMRDDADADAFKADLKKVMAGEFEHDCSIQNHFLAIRRSYADVSGRNTPQPPGETVFRTAAEAATRKAFAEATSLADANAGFAFALVPDAEMKQAIRKLKDQNNPDKGQMVMGLSLLNAVKESQTITVSVALGAAPSITVKARCENDAAAQSVSASLNTYMNLVTALTADLRQMYGKENSPQGAEKVKAIEQAADQLKLIRADVQGNIVELVVNPKTLQAVGRAVTPLVAVARDDARNVASVNNIHQLLTGLILYARDHDDQWPDRLEDLKDILGGAESCKRVMTNPLTGDAEGYIYLKPAGKMSALKDAGRTPIIYEAKAGQKNEAGAIGYADGHVANVRRMLTVP